MQAAFFHALPKNQLLDLHVCACLFPRIRNMHESIWRRKDHLVLNVFWTVKGSLEEGRLLQGTEAVENLRCFNIFRDLHDFIIIIIIDLWTIYLLWKVHTQGLQGIQCIVGHSFFCFDWIDMIECIFLWEIRYCTWLFSEYPFKDALKRWIFVHVHPRSNWKC